MKCSVHCIKLIHRIKRKKQNWVFTDIEVDRDHDQNQGILWPISNCGKNWMTMSVLLHVLVRKQLRPYPYSLDQEHYQFFHCHKLRLLLWPAALHFEFAPLANQISQICSANIFCMLEFIYNASFAFRAEWSTAEQAHVGVAHSCLVVSALAVVSTQPSAGVSKILR